MKILLTGATGFLGSYLLKKLIEQEHDVIILKRSNSNTFRIKDLLNRESMMFDVDLDECESIFAVNRFDCIIHTATEYGRSENAIRAVIEANLILPIRLIELGIRYKVKTFINTDSYFNKYELGYSSLLNYSLSKKSLLIWLKNLSNKIQIANVILEHLYGPHDSETKFVQGMIQKIGIQNVNHVALTAGFQKRDFVYVEDVADAYLAILNHSALTEFKFKIFEVGTGQSVEVKTMALLIKEISKSSTQLGFGDLAYRSDEIMDSKADISALLVLGWHPKYSLRAGVAKILNVYGCDLIDE